MSLVCSVRAGQWQCDSGNSLEVISQLNNVKSNQLLTQSHFEFDDTAKERRRSHDFWEWKGEPQK